MAERVWFARAEHELGIAAADISTAVHFGVGAAAGIAGMDPKIALLLTLVAEGSYEAVKAQDPHTLFHRGVGESRLNQIVDLLSMIVGAYVGHAIRNAREASVAAAAPAPQVEVAPAAPAGLGYCCW